MRQHQLWSRTAQHSSYGFRGKLHQEPLVFDIRDQSRLQHLSAQAIDQRGHFRRSGGILRGGSEVPG